MRYGRTLAAGLSVATGAAIAALLVSSAAGTTTASGSNTVFVPAGVVLAGNGETGILVAGAVDRGGETGTLVTHGTGGGTSTPPRPGGMSGGTGI